MEGPIPDFSVGEIVKAIGKGKQNKAGGKSEVTMELIKALGELGRVGFIHY